jgi:glycerol-3-phosphate acyltransferase PlsY
MLWALPVIIAVCYLVGSIPFPLFVSRLVLGIDLRQHGTGNMGATNAARLLGKKWFPVVFGLDFAKGAAATYIARAVLPGILGIDPVLAATIGAIAAVTGHCFPIFAGFKGGVGLAASAGALALISPWLLLATVIGILIFWGLSRDMYVGTAAAALAAPLSGWLVGLRGAALLSAIALWGLLVFAVHLKDLKSWFASRNKVS